MADSLSGVEALYRVFDMLKLELQSNPFCNSVTMGTLTEIDLAKQTIFPMAHLTLETVTHNDNSLTFQITLFNLDIVEINKDPSLGFYGNDNLMYISTNQLYVVNRLIVRLKESSFFKYDLQLDGNPSSEFINKEMENMLAGYQTTFNLTVPNNIDKC